MGDFSYLSGKDEYNELNKLCELAEGAADSVEKAKSARKALSCAVLLIYTKQGKKCPEDATMLETISNAVVADFVDNPVLMESMHYIRKLGMNAEHGKHVKKTEAKVSYDNLVFLVMYIYKKFEEPGALPYTVLPGHMTEADTRKIYIDLYLNEAGWEVLEPSSKTILPNGQEVKSGIVYPGKACCEIPVKGMDNESGIGFCDYVLYGRDGKPLAIVEAKRTSVDAVAGKKQVRDYGECVRSQYGYVPILYYTNGYEIHIMDGLYNSRQVMAFHSMEELELLIQRRGRKDITDIRINDDITNRPYQKMAVTKICERFNEKYMRGLLVMATGTGKTRVAISLVDILTRNGWVKNVLFLADRVPLVKQAFKNFKKLLPSDTTYCVLSDKKLANEPNARITLSTHQTMIGYIDAEDKDFGCGRFDLVIIDEAHRSIFNRYGSIFAYFDALMVGLTATPRDQVAASTYEIFRCENQIPNFAYSIEEAIQEKYLVPYKVESRTTLLLKTGLRYGNLSEEDKEKVDTLVDEELDDDSVIAGSAIFRTIYNRDTCSRVLDDLMENGLRVEFGQKIGKTIIFAYNHKHAELIVKVFHENYPSLSEDYCQLIDRQVKGAADLITKFEEDDKFRIAVSVDMLDTGVDVPSVLNLVFFKPVKSKIKFIQMIGRGTRLCEGLLDGKDKTHFLIFDYFGNFEYFDEHPDGAENENGKTLSQRLFDIRLDILVELQNYEHQSNERCRAYYEKLKPMLYGKVQQIKSESSRIAVRREMSYVDKYIDYDRWAAIAPVAKKEIQYHLSKLTPNDEGEDIYSLQFDMHMLDIELCVLANGSVARAQKHVETIRRIAKLLIAYGGATTAVQNNADKLVELAGTDFWTSPDIGKMEQYREDIRDLMQYLPERAKPVYINTPDSVIEGGFQQGDGFIDIRTYREKVIDYLAEHLDNRTIRKIQNLEPIDAGDLQELERILWHELGTADDYREATDIDNLAVFIRSIVGLEQRAINEKFGDFLNDNVMNSQQQEFVKAILDYVRENGDIVVEDLIEKSPFDHYDMLELFGTNIKYITDMIEKIHGSVVAA